VTVDEQVPSLRDFLKIPIQGCVNIVENIIDYLCKKWKIFVSKANDTGNQFLGLVTEKTANTITVQHALEENQAIGAKVWRPATSYVFARTTGFSENRMIDTGARTLASRGGQIYTTKTADTTEQRTWTFSSIFHEEFESMSAFLQESTALTSGFSIGFWDRYAQQSVVMAVRNSSPVLDSRGTNICFGGFSLSFFVTNEDSYVVS